MYKSKNNALSHSMNEKNLQQPSTPCYVSIAFSFSCIYISANRYMAIAVQEYQQYR